MIRAVVFDLDGTLIHSAPDLHAAANRMLADLGRPLLTLADVTGFIGNGVPKLVSRCLVATGGENAQGTEALALFRGHYDADPVALTTLYPGVRPVLEAFRAQGLAMGICTNKPEAPARDILHRLDLAAFFPAVVGGDTVGVHKPDPAPALRCLSDLGVPQGAAVYVGDSETDAATAKAAELPFGLFTQGYRKTAVEDFAAAFSFDHFDALPSAVRALPEA